VRDDRGSPDRADIGEKKQERENEGGGTRGRLGTIDHERPGT
jgi:hypothetical protein